MGLGTGSRNMTGTTDGPSSAQGCGNGDLMNSFGIFLQGLLAVMAFSILMCEYIRVCAQLRAALRAVVTPAGWM